MQTAMGEEEKEAKDSQEFSTGAVTLERGLIDSDHADGKVRANRFYVDDEEIEKSMKRNGRMRTSFPVYENDSLH